MSRVTQPEKLSEDSIPPDLKNGSETPLNRKLKEEEAQRRKSLSSEDSAKEPLRPMPSWIEYGQREVDRSQYRRGLP
jgi:hypothetical protein